MNSKKIALITLAFLGLAFMTGCETLGISLQTDYGSIIYELPKPKGTKK